MCIILIVIVASYEKLSTNEEDVDEVINDDYSYSDDELKPKVLHLCTFKTPAFISNF